MAVKNMIKAALVAVVLVCFAGDQLFVTGGYHSNFEDILLENFADFLPLVDLAFKYGAPEYYQTINEYLDDLLDECQKDPHSKATYDIFDYLQRLHSKYEDFTNHYNAKMAIKSIIIKVVPKLITRFGHKAALNILLKTASHPLGNVADGAQILLELSGYEMAGKIVGAGGNILGGALAGFAVGGLPGAMLGGVLGFGIWGIGEYVNYEHVQHLETFVQYFVQ